MTRIPLPNRRAGTTAEVRHTGSNGDTAVFIVTFGFGMNGKVPYVREVFCAAAKTGSDMQALVNDSAISISLLLQHGMTIEEVADAFGENRQEGTNTGPPASPLGAIARAGVQIEREAQR